MTCEEKDDEVTLVWEETGGPRVVAPVGRTGFGGKLLSHSVSGQLGGAMSVEWRPEGAVFTLRASKARLGA